jgi:WD40 repeat protein
LCLATGGDDGLVRLWDPAFGEQWGILPPSGRADAVHALAFAADGRRLAVGSRNGQLEYWDARLQVWQDRRTFFEGPIGALGFLPEGGVLVAPVSQARWAGEPGRVLYWRPEAQGTVALPWPGGVCSLAVLDGVPLAALGDDRRVVEVWQWGPPRPRTLLRLANRPRGLALCPADGGRTLAVACGRAVECWDAEEGRRLWSARGHRGEVKAVAFTTDGRAVLSGGGDRIVRVWDAASGANRGGWDWQVGRILALAVSPDGMTAAAAGERAEVVVWDLGGA